MSVLAMKALEIELFWSDTTLKANIRCPALFGHALKAEP